MKSKIQLTEEQKKACNGLFDWFKSRQAEKYVTLGGYAGTGKSTLIAYIREEIYKENKNKKIAFCCYTGRAALNLKNKLKDNNSLKSSDYCGTIHGLIYHPEEDEDGNLLRFKRVSEMPYDLIIIDEASMVDETIFSDLSKYGKRIIAVGDHGQLGPVKSSDFNLMKSPDFKLERIHRQAEGHPIISLSREIRETGDFPSQMPTTKFIQTVTAEQGERFVKYLMRGVDKETVILCGMNRTRVNLNLKIRESLNRNSDHPLEGDRVVCLKNNRQAEGTPIFNGMLGFIKESSVRTKNQSHHWYRSEIEMDYEKYPYVGNVSKYFFCNAKPGEFKPKEFGLHWKEVGDQFDYGYAITVHKAQGSEFDTVILYPEWSRRDPDDYRRWLYTAVTRAKKNLYIVPRYFNG